jgi:competence protein ComEC
MKSGQVWDMGKSQLRVLWPERILDSGSIPNNASIVFLFETRGFRILLTGDIEREAQQAIMRAHPEVNADIVKVPHHGSPNLDPDFADWAGGRIALFSVGGDNDYGHPSTESLLAWESAQRFRTDQQGSIALYVDDVGDLVVSTEN